MSDVQRALLGLDGPSVEHVRPALVWFRARGAGDRPPVGLVREYLWEHLPPDHGQDIAGHEAAWALGDLFERAGLRQQAALCRAAGTHEVIAGRRWSSAFADVPGEFWRPALASLPTAEQVPDRAALSLASAHALIETVTDGVAVTAGGLLPPRTVQALDDRFRWTEEFPWMSSAVESDIPPLRFLHEHLVAQRLLVRHEGRLQPSAEGMACLRDTGRLWRRTVSPQPRWSQEFDEDALGVMAASLLRNPDFTLGRVAEEMTQVLTGKWRPARSIEDGAVADGGSVFDGASLVAQAWYQLGVPLGWWDNGHGPADRRPNAWGRAAAAAVFRSVARRGG
ncbi:MAG: hypothetical protein ACJ72A_23025 [Nocardioidaceae bacterium]|jgi:hypothetical protein